MLGLKGTRFEKASCEQGIRESVVAFRIYGRMG